MYYKDTKIRKIIGNINLFPNFVTLIVETNTVTRMKDLIITAVIKVYQYDELNEADQALVKTAKDATARSYSPYSHFSVGAAVLLGNGGIGRSIKSFSVLAAMARVTTGWSGYWELA